MGLVAKEGESKFNPVPPGMHLARCYRVVDLGTQRSEYLGTIKHLPKVMLQFEVHGEDEGGNAIVTTKGEPMTISKNFTLSLGEKATLRKDLQTWRGREFTAEELRGFELKNILGAWAMISVIKSTGNNGKEYTNISAIMQVPPQVKKSGLPQGHNKIGLFSIDEPDMEMFEIFSDGLKKKIQESPEWHGRKYAKNESAPGAGRHAAKGSGVDDMEDDIPFN